MAEKIVSGFFLIFSLTYLFFAQDLSFGTLGAPKAGFLATLAGFIATALSLATVVKPEPQQKKDMVDGINLTKVLFVAIGLLCYVAILDVVGYLAATFIIMIYLLKVTDTVGWIIPICLSMAISLGFYVVFKNYLGIYLP